MIKNLNKFVNIITFLVIIFPSIAFAANRPLNMTEARSGISEENVRIVLQFDSVPTYQVTADPSGKNIRMDFSGVDAARAKNNVAVDGDIVQSVDITNTQSGCNVLIALNQAVPYTVNTLQNPARVFIDIKRYYEHTTKRSIESGLDYTAYDRRNADGVLKAYILDIDPSKFELIPVLGGGRTLGKNTVSNMVHYYNAEAGVNASYFGGQKDVYGLTKIDGTVATTTYLARTAFGMDTAGKAIIGIVNYSGSVHTKNGDFPISGVNCDRSADTIVEYNSFYGNSTGTNEYGIEYVVQDNKIVRINTNDTALRDGQIVISAHGVMKDALSGMKVGDEMTVNEDLGDIWKNAVQIVGVGPQLVKDGKVDVTADDEQIGPDVTGGRAPRTAAAIKADGHVMLVVVDGRQSQSSGLTLNGFAQLLIDSGAIEAVNFDGGGSSEMVIGGQITNSPSDGMERPVGVALAVVKKK
ncbi:phosphodiester glycosidase family protein [Pectinatus haikarae]|uniref:Exopolysaccharide biosynthesis protein n=1 Tax=Pectinatus haikarae TaxID=349096 RepID=A0ABT9Y603_9FIRM|nr:phosphodiester glycosidase family protein [Pectinatus haikarae]MDQ0203068.1 exopolysaccharide biosynthesis protein [Pectinatus haikarae]